MGRHYRGGGSLNNENMLYDDSAFQMFFVSVLAVYWICAFLSRTTRMVRRKSRSHEQLVLEKAQNEICPCSLCMKKSNDSTNGKGGKKGWWSTVSTWDLVFGVVSVVLVVGLAKVYAANLTAEQPFDPFEILNVPRNAEKRQISKAYRRLSLQYHPDKNLGDSGASDKFVKLTKAHAALTDPTSRRNFAKYGNPDGYQGTTLGIALPGWVEENHFVIMGVYLVLFVVVFPVVIGIWWMKQSKMLTKNISTETFQLFAECLVKLQKLKDYITAFATATEFEELYKESNVEKVKSLVAKLRKEDLFDPKKARCLRPWQAYQFQNLMVMIAYMNRVEIPKELDYVVPAILERVEPLTTAFIDTMGVIGRPDCSKIYPNMRMRGLTSRVDTVLKVSQHVIQGLTERDSPLLQIPHFTQRLARMCISPRGSRSPVKTLYAFSKLDLEEQKALAQGLTDEEWLDVRAFLDRYPQATLNVSDPFVEDEDDGKVRASDRITIKGSFEVSHNAGSIYSPHCPNLPQKKSEVWWVVLSDKKLNCPIEVMRLTPKDGKLKKISKDSSKDGKDELDPTTTVYDLKFSFMAPRPGKYEYEVRVDVDCYLGCEQSKTVAVQVLEPVEPDESKLPKYFDTDDESSSEEESDEEEENSEHDSDDSECECEGCQNGESEEEIVYVYDNESDTEVK